MLPGSVTMQKRLAALGPQQREVSGGVLRGHAFHYSTCATVLPVAARTQAAPGRKLRGDGEALYAQGSVKASYFHAWFASNPIAAAGLFLKHQHAQLLLQLLSLKLLSFFCFCHIGNMHLIQLLLLRLTCFVLSFFLI